MATEVLFFLCFSKKCFYDDINVEIGYECNV